MTIPMQAEAIEWLQATARRIGLPPEGKATKSITPTHAFGFARRRGKLMLTVEVYSPEHHNDDDDSFTGYLLPARMGWTRHVHDVSGDTLEALVEAAKA